MVGNAPLMGARNGVLPSLRHIGQSIGKYENGASLRPCDVDQRNHFLKNESQFRGCARHDALNFEFERFELGDVEADLAVVVVCSGKEGKLWDRSIGAGVILLQGPAHEQRHQLFVEVLEQWYCFLDVTSITIHHHKVE
jgi:hypothetical protein